MDAWFDILAYTCNEWLKGKQIKFTQNFDETRDTVILSNDWVQDFIDTNLKITNNPDDRIGKNLMLEAVKSQYPQKYLNPIQLITALKDKKIEYNAKYRCDKLQGCFVGVVFQSDLDDDLQDVKDPLDKGIVKDDYKVKYENAKKEIEELKRQLQQPKKDEPKEEVKAEPKPIQKVLISEKDIIQSISKTTTADELDDLIEKMAF
jgi:hypothetical protein